MRRPPGVANSALVSALSVAKVPLSLDRAGRIRLIGEAAKALVAGRLPSREAALLLGGALIAWLENGGNLEKDFLQVVKPKSHRTPAVIWREIEAHQDERQDAGTADTLSTSSQTECDS